uniref:Uncharacterized protein n=1 Tax=Nelumbo nucifera TaxID=4432 RepID=A0A822XG86_NELNU|nr:TPA_asm: hypothetical protein HUJ06_019574 [Nelumbo nucifera]DAD22323.1 TPA_asm: hypothetical protein HUJ06_023786 [Nelumbo nucifera]
MTTSSLNGIPPPFSSLLPHTALAVAQRIGVIIVILPHIVSFKTLLGSPTTVSTVSALTLSTPPTLQVKTGFKTLHGSSFYKRMSVIDNILYKKSTTPTMSTLTINASEP